MAIVISVENLSKTYNLGQIGTGTSSHDLEVWWAKLRGKPNPLLRVGEKDHGNRDGEELWALKDVVSLWSRVKCWASSGATVRGRVPCSKFSRA